MKLTIEFDENKVEDREKIFRVLKSDDICYAFNEVFSYLRKKYKNSKNSEEATLYEQIKEELIEILDSYDINLNELI